MTIAGIGALETLHLFGMGITSMSSRGRHIHCISQYISLPAFDSLKIRAKVSLTRFQLKANPTNGKSFRTAEDQSVQRDILRKVYDSLDLHEIENLLVQTLDGQDIFKHIDGDTALDILCYMAENVERSRLLIHDDQECDDIVKRLYDSCIDIENCGASSLGMLLWALELLPQQRASWRELLLVQIAERECRLGGVSHYSTRELTNIIVTCGHLVGYYFDNCIDRRVMRYIELLFVELSGRVARPHVRSAFGGSDFANLAHSSSLLYGACYNQENEEGCSACHAFLSCLASEAKRKLANRHSSSSRAFSAVELKTFLFSYVKMSILSPDIEGPDMMDQVASYVSGQLKNHSTAYTIQDLAAILEFFAFYKISSVAILDLFTHCGTQIRLVSSNSVDNKGLDKSHCNETDNFTWLAALISVMTSHIQLGIRPSDITLMSVLPAVRFYSQYSEREHKVQLIRIFETLDFHCGDMLKGELIHSQDV